MIGRHVWHEDLRTEVVTSSHWYVTPDDQPVLSVSDIAPTPETE